MTHKTYLAHLHSFEHSLYHLYQRTLHALASRIRLTLQRLAVWAYSDDDDEAR